MIGRSETLATLSSVDALSATMTWTPSTRESGSTHERISPAELYETTTTST